MNIGMYIAIISCQQHFDNYFSIFIEYRYKDIDHYHIKSNDYLHIYRLIDIFRVCRGGGTLHISSKHYMGTRLIKFKARCQLRNIISENIKSIKKLNTFKKQLK